MVFATDPAWRGLLPGQRVTARVRLAPAARRRPDRGRLTRRRTAATAGQRHRGAQRAAGRLRAGLQAACAPLPAGAGGLLPGLVIGDTSRLDPALAERVPDHRAHPPDRRQRRERGDRARRGAVRGPVVPGRAVAGRRDLRGWRWSGSSSWPGRRRACCGRRRWARSALLALAVGPARPAPPALGRGRDRRPAGRPGAGRRRRVRAVGAGHRWRWCCSRRAGATRCVARGVPHVLAEALAVPAAAQVACGPVIVALSGQVSLVAVPANLLAAPAVAPATLLGVGAAVVSPLWPDGGRLLAWLARRGRPGGWSAIAHDGAAVRTAPCPGPAGSVGGLLLAALTVALLVACRRPAARRLVAGRRARRGGGRGAGAAGWPRLAARRRGARRLRRRAGRRARPARRAGPRRVVVDAGPDPARWTVACGGWASAAVPLLVVTHFHADHVGGIAGVLRGRPVGGRARCRTFAEPVAGGQAVRAAAAAAAYRSATAGPGWTLARRIGAAARDRTAPAGDRHPLGPEQQLAGAARRQSGGVRCCSPATPRPRSSTTYCPKWTAAQLRVDVLKVAHHGSAYQDPAAPRRGAARGSRWSAWAPATRTGTPTRRCWTACAGRRAGAADGPRRATWPWCGDQASAS